jgi:hypothetical protein
MAKKINRRGQRRRGKNDFSRGERRPQALPSFTCKQALAFAKPQPSKDVGDPGKAHLGPAPPQHRCPPARASHSEARERGGPVGSWLGFDPEQPPPA